MGPILRRALIVCVAFLPAMFTASGCGSSETTGAPPSGDTKDAGTAAKCAAYVPRSGLDLSSPVFFNSTVIPILQKHCSYGECHGSKEFPILGYYGNPTDGGDAGDEDGTDPQVIKANIVNVRSRIHNSMVLVKPGDPANSFLLRTMDGDHCLLAAECSLPGCGEPMPNDRPLLSEEERAYVRRWIAQGAK